VLPLAAALLAASQGSRQKAGQGMAGP
jgi:hypothetical protein